MLLTVIATAVAVMARHPGSIEPFESTLLQVPIILDTGVYAIVAASDGGFVKKTAMAHLPHREIHEVRTAQSLVDGLERHWGKHLALLRTIHETVGM